METLNGVELDPKTGIVTGTLPMRDAPGMRILKITPARDIQIVRDLCEHKLKRDPDRKPMRIIIEKPKPIVPFEVPPQMPPSIRNIIGA